MLKQMAWGMLKPLLRSWLGNRALILPQSKRVEAARRLNLTEAQVAEVNSLIIAQALEELERFRP